MLPNSLQYPIAVYGALRTGLAVVNVNPLYTPSELSFQLRDSGARVIVVLEHFAHTVEQALPESLLQHVIVTGIGDLFTPIKRGAVNFMARHFSKPVPPWSIAQAVPIHDVLEAGEHLECVEPTLGPGDTAFVQYTGAPPAGRRARS